MPWINVIVAGCTLGCAAIVSALAIPMIRRRIPMNPLYGARFTRSFASDEAWYRINEFAGRRFLSWSVVVGGIGVATLLLPIEDRPLRIVALAMTPLLYLIPTWQSYRFSARAGVPPTAAASRSESEGGAAERS